ncbi:MAG: hypothetical protein MOB07_16335 [Acidobacteria bacterium]|nr:hypothetical protein [Acidobacteriota bacterium]
MNLQTSHPSHRLKRDAPANVTWSPSKRRYTYASNGREVSALKIRGRLQSAIDASKERIDAFTSELIAGKINAAEWTLRMRDEIKNGHRAAALIANGGRLNPSTTGRLGATVRAQYEYLSRFASGIQNGDIPLNGRLRARAKLYAQSVLLGYESQVRARERLAGSKEERRVLSAVEHCVDCVEFARRGWQPIGSLPQIGDSICKSNCHCRFEYRGQGMLPETQPEKPKPTEPSAVIRVEVPRQIADTGANARARLADIEADVARGLQERLERRRVLVDKFGDATGREKRQIERQIIALDRSQAAADDDALDRYRAALYQPSPANFTVVKTGGLDRFMRGQVDEGVAEFQKFVGAGKLEGRTITVYFGIDRPHYQADGVYLDFMSRARTVAHELGHWLEEASPTVRTEILNFYAQRTQGDLLERLMDLDPNGNYEPDENAKKDRFRDPYVGKLYMNARGVQYASEVMSMALQYFYERPLSFAKDEPEFFDFIYELLRK